MIPDNVTLIVKAPNQQIEDQNVECQSSWTVRQLKGHLSVVYPSKPSTDEQKIIYSGKLLDDNAVLKDVLRTYESQIGHTMHLVCTPKRRMADKVKPAPSTDGLRHRHVPNVPTTVQNGTTEQPVETPRPETRQNDQNHSVEMQNYLSSYMNNYGRVPPYPNYNMGEGYLPVPNDPASLANHMMMMQQAYFQYMQQYANMWQPGMAPMPTPPPEAPAPPAPPARAPEEEEAPRDWLEHLYAASRLGLLCSLVYLYGSPARLLLVLLLAAAGYLHQIGFFRDLQLNPQPEIRPAANENGAIANGNANNANIGLHGEAGNQNAGVPNANIGNPNANIGVPNANIGNPNANIGVPNADIGNPNADIGNPNADIGVPNVNIGNANVNVGNANALVNADENQQSLLAVTWMIFTTFFASLIPDNN